MTPFFLQTLKIDSPQLTCDNEVWGVLCEIQVSFIYLHFDGLVQDCNNSNALAMELLQSCTKPSFVFNVLSLFNSCYHLLFYVLVVISLHVFYHACNKLLILRIFCHIGSCHNESQL